MPLLPLLLTLALSHQPDLRLNGLFCDGMVLQRGANDPVFGTASPGSFVEVQIANQHVGASADRQGRWQIQLTSLAAPGPYDLTVQSGSQTLTVHDVQVGEVWLASGQSNMEFQEYGADDYAEAQADTKPDVRMFVVRRETAEKPVQTVGGKWEPASPTTIGHFSAVGLAFARELNRKLGVPIGIIDATWGGTPIESWESMDALVREPKERENVTQYSQDLQDYSVKKPAYDEAMRVWMHDQSGGENQGYLKGWPEPDLADADWKDVPAGTMVENIVGRPFIGSFWYRQTVDIPAEWVNKPLKLELGAIDDYDTTYFNGVRVGRIDQKTENAGDLPRVYTVSPGLVHSGANTIAIRVFNATGSGGMRGPADAMRIGLADGSASVPLSPTWKFKVEQEIDPSAARPKLPGGPRNPYSPSELFNGMIAPLIPYAIKGAIWYQGEANVGHADVYKPAFQDLIRDWRSKWGEAFFPFYFVQLANYLPRKDEPVDSQWARLREAQTAGLALPQTGMAVTIDIGEADTIHPRNKKEVGRRLAIWALAKTYHVPTVYGSPLYLSMVIKGSAVEITFSNGSLATTDGQPPRGFEIAGADHVFHWATASIYGSTVTVSSPEVKDPVAVRYGWADNPDVNLVNRMGLPASPFRTDDWERQK